MNAQPAMRPRPRADNLLAVANDLNACVSQLPDAVEPRNGYRAALGNAHADALLQVRAERLHGLIQMELLRIAAEPTQAARLHAEELSNLDANCKGLDLRPLLSIPPAAILSSGLVMKRDLTHFNSYD